MYCINVVLTVKNLADVEKVAELLTQAGRLSRLEPGCQRFEAYHSTSNPQRFFLCEHWDSKEALDVHRTAQAYTTIYAPQVLPLVEREGNPCELLM